MRNNGEYSQIAALIQKTIDPLTSKIDKLEGKIDLIFIDYVKRSDLENLRKDFQSIFIQRAEYEPRHDALISRDSYLEGQINRIEAETQSEFQRLHERLESGKQQIENRFDKQKEESISGKERLWMRAGTVFSILVALIAIITFAIEHFH